MVACNSENKKQGADPTTTDLQGDENFLIETGTYEIKDANKKLADRGKYVIVWKKQNGEWKLYRDIGASSPIESR